MQRFHAPFLFLVVLAFGCQTTTSKPEIIRAAIDIGSGTTTLRIAKVDSKIPRITTILHEEAFKVNYQEDLARSKNGGFSPELVRESLETFSKISDIIESYQADDTLGLATASFRSATNAHTIIERAESQFKIPIQVIDQELEARIAFRAVQATRPAHGDFSVWDIGGGSLQFVTLAGDGVAHTVYRGDRASIAFKNLAIEKVQGKDPSKTATPNPLTLRQIEAAKLLTPAFVEGMNPHLKAKLSSHPVYAVGRVFGGPILSIMGNEETFEVRALARNVLALAGKTDNDIGNAYANVYVTNGILVLGIMETLGIQKVTVIPVDMSHGAFLLPELW